MAIEKRPSKKAPSGCVYRVRYPDPRTGRLLSATFDTERDAEDFDALWRVKRRSGQLDQLDAGQQLLGDYVLDWLKVWQRDKASKTKGEIARIIDRLILGLEHTNGTTSWARGSIAWLQLRQIDARVIERWMHDHEDAHIGSESLRKALYVLQQVFRRALAFRDYAHANPVTLIDKPKAGERRRPEVFTPDVVEATRAIFLARGDLMSATLVSTMAYSGCRPGEILAAQVKHLKKNGRLLIEQRNSMGEILSGAKSRARRVRTVPLPKVLVDDLEAWIEARGLSDDDPLFPNTRGTYWSDSDYRNWRRRTFQPAARRGGFGQTSANPYTLRHVYISLRYAAGHNPIEVAAAAGHSPTLSQDYYGAAIQAYEAQGPIDWEREITKARKKQRTA